MEDDTLWRIKNEAKEEACTILHCTYVAKMKYVNGGWVNIHAKTVLHKSEGFMEKMEQVELLHAFNVPIAPAKHHFSQAGDVIRFTLYFPALPADWDFFTLLEDTGYFDGFTAFEIPRNSTGVYSVFLI
jgi:hypothetical protein